MSVAPGIREAARAWLGSRLGLGADALTDADLDRAIGARVRAGGHPHAGAWLARLGSEAEAAAFVEEVVVLETWFFRDRTPFEHVAALAARHRGGPFRVLSAPCATGEEAWSIAIALLEAGLSPSQFQVDGIDVSARAVSRAVAGRYRGLSFRGEPPEWLARWTRRVGDEVDVGPEARAAVSLRVGNVFDRELLAGVPPYHAIFCRNLLIYLEHGARGRALGYLVAALAPEGRLYLGHAENLGRFAADFRLEDVAAFAHVRRTHAAPPAPRRPAPPRPRPAAPRPPPPRPVPSAVPPASDTLLQRATALADRGELDAAAALCDALLREEPIADGYALRGVLELAASDLVGAEASFVRALYLDPDHVDALLALASLRERDGDPGAAARYRRRAERHLAPSRGSPRPASASLSRSRE